MLPIAGVIVDGPEHPHGPIGKQRGFVSVLLPEGLPDPAEGPSGFRVIEPLYALKLRTRRARPDKDIAQYRERSGCHDVFGAVTAAIQRAHIYCVPFNFYRRNLFFKPYFARQLCSQGSR